MFNNSFYAHKYKMVQIGLLENINQENDELRSKIGGFPFWICEPLSADTLKCKICSIPMILLVQIDTPLDNEDRVIYIFICASSCLIKNSIYVLRSWRIISDIDNFVNSCCDICGLSAPYRCSACHKRRYCSKSCQIFDWSHHKIICKSSTIHTTVQYRLRTLPEYDLVVIDNQKSNENEFIYDQAIIPIPQENEQYESTSKYTDVYFYRFQKATSHIPRQVMRYLRINCIEFTEPLWANIDRPTIPPCPHCQSSRQPELQILPQIIYLMNLPSGHSLLDVDFGTIIIYTCINDCRKGVNTAQEIGYVQFFDISQ